MRLLCLGYGYAARAFAELARPETLTGTRREAGADSGEAGEGAQTIAFDGGAASEALATAARDATHVLISIPPDEEGCSAFRALASALSSSTSLAWLGYFSTTGVYGNRDGGWCFEWQPPTPTSARAERRVRAEAQWLSSGAPAHVFRLPGIYGPGRSQLERARAGADRAVVKPGLVFNRIHVTDIAGALMASCARPRSGGIYNLVDDRPSPPQDVTAEARRLLDLPMREPIPFSEAGLVGMAAEFYSESKRCSNARAKAELGWRPVYPSYVEGLAALAST